MTSIGKFRHILSIYSVLNHKIDFLTNEDRHIISFHDESLCEIIENHKSLNSRDIHFNENNRIL